VSAASGLYFWDWFVFSFLVDGLTILLLFPDTSKKSMLLAGAAATAFATIIASVVAAGIRNALADDAGPYRSLLAGRLIPSAFHLTVLGLRFYEPFAKHVRPTYIVNSLSAIIWRLAVLALIESEAFSSDQSASSFVTISLRLLVVFIIMYGTIIWD